MPSPTETYWSFQIICIENTRARSSNSVSSTLDKFRQRIFPLVAKWSPNGFICLPEGQLERKCAFSALMLEPPAELKTKLSDKKW